LPRSYPQKAPAVILALLRRQHGFKISEKRMTTTPAWKDLYPFQSHELNLDSNLLHYIDQGKGLDQGNGNPLLMVHGNPTWSFYWRNLITAFSDRYRVVVPDHIGCGLSSKPADYPYTLAQHVENLTKLIQHLDLRNITLLAHDWGGAIGLGCAVQNRDRFARIVLFNTGAFPPPFIPFRIRICRTPLLGRLAVQGLNLFARCALWMAVENRACLTAPVKAGLLAPYDCWANRVAIYQFVRDIPFSRRHPTWQMLAEIETALPSLAADRPVQLIWGMKDWCFTPVCLDRFLKSFPRAEVHRLADAGHYVIEEAHQQIIPLVEQFLTAHPIGG